MRVQSVQNYCFSLLNMQICDFFSTSSSWFLKLPNTSLQIVFFLKVLTLTLFYQAPKLETSLCVTLRETIAYALLTVRLENQPY